MTPENYSLMKSWLKSGDEQQKRHAAHRLAMPDAVEFERSGVDTTLAHPSLASMFTSAVSTAADFAASGFAVVDQAERERRLAICRACEHYESGRCKACGCWMQLKARIAETSCPLPEPKW